MPSSPLTVLLVDQPGWTRDLVEAALRNADLTVESIAASELPTALERSRPDFVVLTEAAETTQLPGDAPHGAGDRASEANAADATNEAESLGPSSSHVPGPPASGDEDSVASPTLPLPPPSELEALVASHLRPRLVRLAPSGTANVFDVRLSVGQPLGSMNAVEIADLVTTIGAPPA